MSSKWVGDELLQPISDDRPCGQNFEDKQELAAFAAYPVFGKTTSPDATPDPPGKPVEWRELRKVALDTLGKSKDLRVLVHLGAALLRTDGLLAFLNTPVIASKWLETYWGETYPLVDGDGIARTSALNCFADPMAVVDRLRRIPLVANAHGKVALRDLDIASGKLPPAAGEEPPQPAQIDAAFAAVPLEQLNELQQGVERAVVALGAIEKAIDTGIQADLGSRTTPEEAAEAAAAAALAAGATPEAAESARAAASAKAAAAAANAATAATEAAPNFEALLGALRQMDGELRGRVAAREPKSQSEKAEAESSASNPASVAKSPGAINSRQDAVRALEAVADFFRRTEPSSPIPLFLERAQRLVSKNFLDVLADVAPEAVPPARTAVGLPAIPE